MKVFVYYNLHKKVWSVKALEGENKGRVVAYGELVTLANAKPKVSEKGRQRVLRERRKNVHAGVVGELLEELPDLKFRKEVVTPTYNPYKGDKFVDLETKKEWTGSDYVVMFSSNRGILGLNKGEI